MTNDDMKLVREYAQGNSERAFSTLVSRHVNLVYSVALRQVRDPHLAEEITQGVFIILARKARSLSPKTILAGWLCRTARYASADAVKIQRRRQFREQEAYMQSNLGESEANAWKEIAPLLDEALNSLGEREHNAIMLRFFEGKDWEQVGAELGTGEDNARMRVNRGLERLRKVFLKRGLTLSTSIIASAVSAHSVQAAPIGLVTSVTAAAVKGTAVTATTLSLVAGAMKVTAWTKAKLAAVIGAALVVATGTTTVVFNHAKPSPIDAYLSDSELTAFRKAPPLVLIQPTHIAKMKGREITIAVNENGKRVGRCVWLGSMIADAYGFSLQRIVFTTGTPTNYYDYLLTVPDPSSEKFKEEIKRIIGYVGRKETRTVDVLLLRTNYSTATKLKASTDRYRQSTDAERRKNAFKTSLSFPTLASLTSELETFLWRPVIDETGLTNSCAVVLDWKPQWKPPVEIRPGRTAEIQPDREMSEPRSGLSDESLLALKAALLDQAGLELVPSRESVEMLVVERERD